MGVELILIGAGDQGGGATVPSTSEKAAHLPLLQQCSGRRRTLLSRSKSGKQLCCCLVRMYQMGD
jgi:hypothetical protein